MRKFRFILFAVGFLAGPVFLDAGAVMLSRSCQDDYEALIRQGDNFLVDIEYDKAIEAYTKAIELNPKKALGYRKRASAKYLKALGHDDDPGALADYEKAILLDPLDAEAYCGKAECLSSLKRYPESLEACDTALAINPKYAEALSLRSSVKFNLKDFKGAIADIDAAVALKPTDESFLFVRAGLKEGTGDFQGALADCARSLEVKPNDWAIFHLRAKIFLKMGNPKEALKEIDRALAIHNFEFLKDLKKQIQTAIK